MQIVKWGKKHRQVKVLDGWKFLKNGQKVKEGDRYFNQETHTWDSVKDSDIGNIVGPGRVEIAIRRDIFSLSREVDNDSHAVRECE